MKNDNMRQAKSAKNDEFYTQYPDIQAEINAYLDYNPDTFKDKTILCPCDDPEWSNFTKFFAQNFEFLGLKKLISTSYAVDAKERYTGQQIPYQVSFFELNGSEYDETKTRSHGKIFVLDRDKNASGRIDIDDLTWDYLDGDGDFRSDEVTALRDEADIIVTNPPFSLFCEFVKWIMEAEKEFLIIGNVNAISYKDVFPLIKDNKMWVGCRFNKRVNGENMTFRVPDSYPMKGTELYINDKGEKFISVAGTGWFTNLEHGRRHQPLSLLTMSDNLRFSKHKEIRERGYLTYDNYDALEVPFTDAIPSDYDGVMGVPVSFLDKFNPQQFEILGITDRQDSYGYRTHKYTTDEYSNANDLNARACIKIDGVPKAMYARILIRKKK